MNINEPITLKVGQVINIDYGYVWTLLPDKNGKLCRVKARKFKKIILK